MRAPTGQLPPMRAVPPPSVPLYSRPPSPRSSMRPEPRQGLGLPSMNSLRLYESGEGPARGAQAGQGAGLGRAWSPGPGARPARHSLQQPARPPSPVGGRPASPGLGGGGVGGGSRMSLSHLMHPQPASSPASFGGGLRRPGSPGLGRPPSRAGTPALGVGR